MSNVFSNMIPSTGSGSGSGTGLTTDQTEFLSHWDYDASTRRLVSTKAIETTLNSLYLGEQHKMSSGAENIFFTNLGNDTNFFPMWGGLKDQSITANQDSTGFIPPSGRVYTDMFSLILGGDADNTTSIGYSGGNYFALSIAGLGITTVAAETVPANVRLEYRLSVNNVQVYMQVLPRNASRSSANEIIQPNDVIEWFFDHPVEIHAGTTIYAEIIKVRESDDVSLGVFQVREGNVVDPDTGNPRYHAIVHNRLFTDKDLELISPYLKYKAMDFGLDATNSSILLRDLTLGSESLLIPHPINTLEAVANGATIKIKAKGGQKVIIEALPVSGASVDGTAVNSVLNQAIIQLNDLFTATNSFVNTGNPVTGFALVGNDLTLTLQDATSYTVDVTTLGVDSNKFVSSGALSGTNLVLTMNDSSTVTIDATNMINGSQLSSLGQNWYVSYGTEAGTEITSPITSVYTATYSPQYYGDKLKKGHEFVWTQYHLPNNAAYYTSIGVWDGATDGTGASTSTAVTNWSTKFGFFSNTLTEDTSTLTNGGYSSKNTDIGSGVTYTNGTIMRLVYSSDDRLRLYADDVLIATTIVAETGNDLDISFVGSNNGIELPDFINRASNWDIVHDFDSSETGILDGIEEDTVIQTFLEINPGEKAMVDLSNFGRSHRIGLNYTGASTGVSNPYNSVSTPIVYGTSEQIIAQNAGEWSFNTSALYYTNANGGKWNVPSANAGMVSFRYHSDNSVDLYSETYQEVIATRLTNLLGSAFKVSLTANENVPNFVDLPTVSKQTIGQSFQPRTTYAPTVVNQSVNVTELDVLNYSIVSSDYIVNQYVAENAPSWMSLNQNTGVLSGTAPAFSGTSADVIVVNCKAGNAVGGVTNFTVTVNVQDYTNTKSIKFGSAGASLAANSANVTAFTRTGSGSGSSDAWTLSMWVKADNSTNIQNLFRYGGNNTYTTGAIRLTIQSGTSLVLNYGSQSDSVFFVVQNAVTQGAWNHITISYNGGATATTSDAMNNFSIVTNGAVKTQVAGLVGSGWTGDILATGLTVGNFYGATSVENFSLNQVAFWNSDEFANRAAIYNSGATQDMSLLASAPSHFYEIENSVVTVSDLVGSAHFTGYNFASSDLITDAP